MGATPRQAPTILVGKLSSFRAVSQATSELAVVVAGMGTFNVLAGDKVAADLHDAPAAVGLIRRGGLRDGTARFQKGGFREDDALFLHQVVPVPEE